jgi:hypothetical protein
MKSAERRLRRANGIVRPKEAFPPTRACFSSRSSRSPFADSCPSCPPSIRNPCSMLTARNERRRKGFVRQEQLDADDEEAAASDSDTARMGDQRSARCRRHPRVRVPWLDTRPSRSARARARRRPGSPSSATGRFSRCCGSAGKGRPGLSRRHLPRMSARLARGCRKATATTLMSISGQGASPCACGHCRLS